MFEVSQNKTATYSISIYLSIHLRVSQCNVCVSLCPSVCLSVSLFVFLFMSPYWSICLCPSVCFDIRVPDPSFSLCTVWHCIFVCLLASLPYIFSALLPKCFVIFGIYACHPLLLPLLLMLRAFMYEKICWPLSKNLSPFHGAYLIYYFILYILSTFQCLSV